MRGWWESKCRLEDIVIFSPFNQQSCFLHKRYVVRKNHEKPKILHKCWEPDRGWICRSIYLDEILSYYKLMSNWLSLRLGLIWWNPTSTVALSPSHSAIRTFRDQNTCYVEKTSTCSDETLCLIKKDKTKQGFARISVLIGYGMTTLKKDTIMMLSNTL